MSAKVRVVRVRTRDTLVRPEIVDLIRSAVEKMRYPGLQWPMFVAELVRRVDEPGLGLFIAAAEDGANAWAPRGLALGILPSSVLMMAPQLPVVYSEGPSEVLKALFRAVTKWLGGEGYDRMMSCAFRHKPAAWARRFRGMGEFREVAPLIEVRF